MASPLQGDERGLGSLEDSLMLVKVSCWHERMRKYNYLSEKLKVFRTNIVYFRDNQ